MKDIIQNRVYKVELKPTGFSTLDYYIVASPRIIRLIHGLLKCVEDNYPKKWGKNNKMKYENKRSKK